MYGSMSTYVWLTYPYTDYLAPTPFHTLLMEHSGFRISQNSDAQVMTPWLADRSFNGRFAAITPDYPQPLCYYENVLHALASGVVHFNVWNPDASSTDSGERALNSILREFDSIVGGANVSHYIQDIIDPHDASILSGFFANRYVYRFTPEDLDPASHIVEGEAEVTVTVGSRSYIFSAGRVLHVSNSLASGGAWIVSPSPVQAESAAN